jgi:hypothetical protein
MIRNTVLITFCILLSGCQALDRSPRQHVPSGPPLPATVSVNDLVDHLNAQSGGLNSWQCTNMRMTAKMPRQPEFRFKGHIACESPNRFHLSASNVLGLANLGSNDERCWVLMKPFDAGTISWRHEDAHLIQEIPSGIPYIDPDWLMLVLGVKELDASDYTLQPGPQANSREFWLTSNENTQGSGISRYVIKVDMDRRVVREHVAYDTNLRPVIRARLSEHKDFNGHLLPTEVALEFPDSGARLELAFKQIQTNPSIDASHWVVPSDPYGKDVDLGQMVAARKQAERSNQFAQSDQKSKRWSDSVPVEEPVWSDPAPVEEPDWDTSISQSRVVEASYEHTAGSKRSIWRRVLDPFHLIGNR